LFNEILSEPEEQTQDNSEWQWAWQEKPDEEERLRPLAENGVYAETIAGGLEQIRYGHKYRHLSAPAPPLSPSSTNIRKPWRIWHKS
jgi:[glutamate--ammonia-ligase] adenylyltransferase